MILLGRIGRGSSVAMVDKSLNLSESGGGRWETEKRNSFSEMAATQRRRVAIILSRRRGKERSSLCQKKPREGTISSSFSRE